MGEYGQKDLTSETSNKLTWESGLAQGKKEGLSTLLCLGFSDGYVQLYGHCFENSLGVLSEFYSGSKKVKVHLRKRMPTCD